MGSKSRFSKEILEIVLSERRSGQWYVEPFAGGMNLISEVDGKRIANDCNRYLIKMWEKIIEGWTPDRVSRDDYGRIRKDYTAFEDHLIGWVGFNCSYSGKWFGGFAGETKTKTGKLRDYQAEAIKNVLTQAKKMKGVVFQNVSYLDLHIPDESIVYCDPPYQGTTGYYESFDHFVFWDWVRKLSKTGHSVFVSEYKAPEDFECLWRKEAKSSLSSNGICGGSKSSIEKLFRIQDAKM